MMMMRKLSRTLYLCLFSILILAVLPAVRASQQGSFSKRNNKKVLALGAANGWTNWTAVEESLGGTFALHFADLDGFGDTMRQKGFQAALEEVDERLRRVIRLLQPAVILVCSKGLNVLTYLAKNGMYTGAAVLLSPIPNECDHVRGQTWVQQWTDSMTALKKLGGPIAIGIGTSSDEKTLIADMMNETKVCGELVDNRSAINFELCPKWFLHTFPGNHGWKNEISNADHIAALIKAVIVNENECKA